MVLLQFMAPVAGLNGAGVPEGKAHVRHDARMHAPPAAQPYLRAYAGHAGNPLKLADAAVMVNRPGPGNHGNERPPRQAFAHFIDVGKACAFQLEYPVARCLPLELDKRQERVIPQLRITPDADTVTEPVVQRPRKESMAAKENIMACPGIEIRGNLRRHAENQAGLPRKLVGGSRIQPDRVQLVHIHHIRTLSVEPAQAQGRRGGKAPGTAGHPAQIQVRHPVLHVHAPMTVSGIHGAEQFKIGLRGKNGLGSGLPYRSGRAIVPSGIGFRIIAGIITV